MRHPSQRWAVSVVGALLALGIGVGCASRNVDSGLSNAPAANRPDSHEDRGHDAIANGPEGCPKPGSSGADPLPIRAGRCPESAPAASSGR